MADTQDWVEQAKDAILALLDIEQALGHPEIESRLSEGGYDGSTTIDPHHLTTALRELGQEERIVFQMHRQPIGPVETEPFLEVRNGLAFTDLITGSDANPQVQKRLRNGPTEIQRNHVRRLARNRAGPPPLRPSHQPRPHRHPSRHPGKAARRTPPPERTRGLAGGW